MYKAAVLKFYTVCYGVYEVTSVECQSCTYCTYTVELQVIQEEVNLLKLRQEMKLKF